jgi:hypothetical protein
MNSMNSKVTRRKKLINVISLLVEGEAADWGRPTKAIPKAQKIAQFYEAIHRFAGAKQVARKKKKKNGRRRGKGRSEERKDVEVGPGKSIFAGT